MVEGLTTMLFSYSIISSFFFLLIAYDFGLKKYQSSLLELSILYRNI